MLRRVTIQNWQSLRDVDLELGRLTVIVGASNSGKSAFIRALRAAANNPRRRGYVTHGAKTATVTVTTDRHDIVYLRGETTSVYRLRPLGGEFEEFTDLAGSVPEQITAALGIPPTAAGHSLHIAGQFDAPFLLDESGATVARVLGELTNVNVIFRAVAEANRRRAALAATLKTRQADLDAARAQARTFADLPAQLAAVDGAETAAAAAQQLHTRMQRLHRLTDSLQVAETVLARTAVPDVPADAALLAAHTRRSRFLTLLGQLRAANAAVTVADAAIEQAAADVTAAHDELHTALAAAGTCPTCGQHVPA